MDSLNRPRQALRRLARVMGREQVMTVTGGVGAGLRIGSRYASADYRTGTNELPVQEALRDLLGAGDTFFDVGSNIGFFALIGAKQVGPRGQVHAFEPVADIAEAARLNASRNGLDMVTVHTVAVADIPSGYVELMLAAHPGGATLSTTDEPNDLSGRLPVPVTTLDQLVAEGRCPVPDVVKIDVEGAEMQVLDGMARQLAGRRPALVCELDAPDTIALEAKVVAWRARMASVDYDVVDLPDSYTGSGWHVYHAVARPRTVGTGPSRLTS
jgi:FkbM family methyltransferase